MAENKFERLIHQIQDYLIAINIIPSGLDLANPYSSFIFLNSTVARNTISTFFSSSAFFHKRNYKNSKINHFKTIRIIQGRMAPHLFQEIQQSECSWMAAILPHDRQASYEVFDKALLIEKA